MRTALDLLSKIQLRYPGMHLTLSLGDADHPLRIYFSEGSVNIDQADLDRSVDDMLPEIFAIIDDAMAKKWDWLK